MKATLKILNKPLKTLVVSALLFSGAAALSQPTYAQADTSNIVYASQSAAVSEYKQYLEDNYQIKLSNSLTKGEFVNAISQILGLNGQEVEKNQLVDLTEASPYYKSANALFANGILAETTFGGDQQLSQLNAAIIAVNASDFKELSFTYPEAKVVAALSKLGLKAEYFSLPAAQTLAVAVDTGIIPASSYLSFKPGAPISSDEATSLLIKVLDIHGNYKHYIGYVQDNNIYSKVYDSYRTQDIIKADDLRNIFDTALKQDIITGYNLKDNRYNPNFDSKLTLAYGHSDITHALQLIGLLKSEGINAKVQLEPKTSAFIYLKEWGEPSISDDYQVVQIENGNFIAYSKEYDISFEFDTVKHKEAFDAIISKYAKKNDEDQSGLIKASWWQPLYSSINELPNYKQITNNKISRGNYYAQSYTLTQDSAAVVAGLKKIDSKAEVTSYDFWVDLPFYSYLSGEDYK